MMFINLQNVEELIFRDAKLRGLLPGLRHIFDQWMLSQRLGILRSLRLQSLADMLNSLTSEHVRVLEEYFLDTIALDKIDYRIVKNLTMSLKSSDAVERELFSFDGFGNFTASRDAERLYVSLWR